MVRLKKPTPDNEIRSGYTLIELLIVIGILLLLAVISLSAVNVLTDGDRVRGAARQVQSYLEGARDRAIYAKQPRGVRFILDGNDVALSPTDPRQGSRVVKSMIYIAESDPWDSGNVYLERLDEDNDGTADTTDSLAMVVRSADGATGWKRLYDSGLLLEGSRIELPKGSGSWYSVNPRLLQYANPSNYPERLILTVPYKDAPDTDGAEVRAIKPPDMSYALEMPPIELSGESPVLLPTNTVIHLDRCSDNPNDANSWGNKLPVDWMIAGTNRYNNRMDVMFSPRGTVMGLAARSGLIHLYVGDQEDADQDRADWAASLVSVPEYLPLVRAGETFERGDKTAVTIFTRTGAISSHPIHPLADRTAAPGPDPFRYAETGEVAGR